MLNVYITSRPEREQWEQVMSSATTPQINQSWEWGEVMEMNGGVKAIRLLALIDSKPVGILQGVEWKAGPVSMAITSGESGGGGGPVVSENIDQEKELEIAKKLLQDFIVLFQKKKALKFTLYASTKFGEALTDFPQMKRAIKWTPVISLETDEKPMLENRIEQKTRNQIFKSQKHGIEVIEGTREDLKSYRSIQSELVQKKYLSKQHLNSLSALERMWDTLSPKGMVKLYLAKYHGEIVGGAIVFYSGKGLVYKSGVLSEEGRNLYAGNALQWEIIRRAIRAGYKTYNMSGGTKEESDPLYGITKFKLSFGGELKPFLRYSAHGNRILRFLVYRARRFTGKNEWFPLVVYP